MDMTKCLLLILWIIPRALSGSAVVMGGTIPEHAVCLLRRRDRPGAVRRRSGPFRE